MEILLWPVAKMLQKNSVKLSEMIGKFKENTRTQQLSSNIGHVVEFAASAAVSLGILQSMDRTSVPFSLSG